MPRSRTADRLRRLLAVVPYIVAHPGCPVAELTTVFGLKEGELLDALGKLGMTGLPPYSPGDLIEFDVEEGKVWLRMADHFARPLRITRPEALSLHLKGTALLGLPGLQEAEALRSALEKLREALGETLPAEAGEEAPPGPLAELRAAVAGRERLEVEYYSATRDEMTERRIDPEHVFGAIGHWYVVAWDHLSDAERLFRLDRFRVVRPTGETFEPRGLMGQGRPLYTPSEKDTPVRLSLAPGARWVSEYFEVTDEAENDGALEVTLPVKDLAWVAKLVLRLGGDAEVLDPPRLRDLARALADEALALY